MVFSLSTVFLSNVKHYTDSGTNTSFKALLVTIKYDKGKKKNCVSEDLSVFCGLLAGYCAHDMGLQVKRWQL